MPEWQISFKLVMQTPWLKVSDSFMHFPMSGSHKTECQMQKPKITLFQVSRCQLKCIMPLLLSPTHSAHVRSCQCKRQQQRTSYCLEKKTHPCEYPELRWVLPEMGVSHNGRARSQIRLRKAPSVMHVYMLMICTCESLREAQGFILHVISSEIYNSFNIIICLFLLSMEAFSFLFCVHSDLFCFYLPNDFSFALDRWSFCAPEWTHRNKPMWCFPHL